jgi:hypothetical protein
MKLYKLKSILIAACCAITALWAETRGMEEEGSVLENVFGNALSVVNLDFGKVIAISRSEVNEVRGSISNLSVQLEQERLVNAGLNDRLFNMEQERQAFTRMLDQVRQQNSIANEKLESLSQELITYKSSTSAQLQSISVQLEQERGINVNLNEQLLNMTQERQVVVQLREQLEIAQNKICQIEMGLPIIPLAARGHEAVYQRFLNGVLIYRPKEGDDLGRIHLPIAALGNPLEGTFDLSRCGDSGKHLSISVGYRKGKIAENANKVEIWFAPRFLIEKELKTTAAHFQEIFGNWNDNAPVGIFWTGGWWDNKDYYYLTTQSLDELSNNTLYVKSKRVGFTTPRTYTVDVPLCNYAKNFTLIL